MVAGQRPLVQEGSGGKAGLQKRIAEANTALLAHFHVVMPKAALTAGSVAKLASLKDTELAARISSLCWPVPVTPVHGPGALPAAIVRLDEWILQVSCSSPLCRHARPGVPPAY